MDAIWKQFVIKISIKTPTSLWNIVFSQLCGYVPPGRMFQLSQPYIEIVENMDRINTRRSFAALKFVCFFALSLNM